MNNYPSQTNRSKQPPAKQRVAVVTGAERGLGREIAKQLSANPGVLTIVTARDIELAKNVVSEIQAAGGQACAETLDVASNSSAEGFAERVKERFGELHILVNNAGVCIDDGDSAVNADPDIVKRTLETNLFGAWRMTRVLVPLMKYRRPGARIVNISSSMGQLETMEHDTPAYRLSKTALNALTAMCASELDAFGIVVNAVDPGWVRTEMGGMKAPLTVEEGAAEPVRLALLGDNAITGGFYLRGQMIRW
jgi:NAD(P)-dependent dehydrogenase (short-subunit alcohol dehydrogenase family)